MVVEVVVAQLVKSMARIDEINCSSPTCTIVMFLYPLTQFALFLTDLKKWEDLNLSMK